MTQLCAFLRSPRDFPQKSDFQWLIRSDVVRVQFCTNIGEAWRKRRYPAHFVSKLSDSEGEAEETRVWLEVAFRCGYIAKDEADELDLSYDGIIGQLVRMIESPEHWSIRPEVKHAGV